MELFIVRSIISRADINCIVDEGAYERKHVFMCFYFSEELLEKLTPVCNWCISSCTKTYKRPFLSAFGGTAQLTLQKLSPKNFVWGKPLSWAKWTLKIAFQSKSELGRSKRYGGSQLHKMKYAHARLAPPEIKPRTIRKVASFFLLENFKKILIFPRTTHLSENKTALLFLYHFDVDITDEVYCFKLPILKILSSEIQNCSVAVGEADIERAQQNVWTCLNGVVLPQNSFRCIKTLLLIVALSLLKSG